MTFEAAAETMDPSRLVQIYEKTKPFLPDPSALFLVVDFMAQKIFSCRGTGIVESWDASTSSLGTGNREGSNRTPTGLHRVAEKIGAGAPETRIFRDRRDSGKDWRPGLTGDNLILARILRLQGLEPGLNNGPGIDSFDRYIYIHGTNQTGLVGTPLTHGCVCLRPADIIRLFDAVAEGTVVFIDGATVTVSGYRCSNIHFAGIFGSGMSALAQYLRWRNVTVSGSDRLLASADTAQVRQKLDELGCNIFPQDGSGITDSTDAVCVSTAIEESNPDIAAARRRNIPVFHRSDMLAALVAAKTTVAVAGTSGKSTVTAMIFEFLDACGKSPSLISGAALLRLEKEGFIGNAFAGSSDLLVVEADESDGTLVKYRPAASVVLNISKDHKSVDEIGALFAAFSAQSGWTAVNADDRGLDRIGAAERFGTHATATWRPDRIDLGPASVTVHRRGRAFDLPLPGSHNAENLLAALCVCEHFGCDQTRLAAAVKGYQGVARRFSMYRTAKNVTVVDDFAHNPAKIAAAVNAARGLAGRIIAIYQPHGFGPTRFLKNDYIQTFRSVFGPADSLYLLPIYYAGGTAVKDISSQDIIAGLGDIPFKAGAVADRDELLSLLPDDAKAGDCILLMGARDPSLPGLAKKIVELFN